MAKFSFTPKGVAGLFLRRMRFPPGRDDQIRLGEIIQDAFDQGVLAGLEAAKDEYRGRHSGGCKMLSIGDACDCFLCDMDEKARAVNGR